MFYIYKFLPEISRLSDNDDVSYVELNFYLYFNEHKCEMSNKTILRERYVETNDIITKKITIS